MSFDGNGTFIRTDGVRSGADLYAQQDAADVNIGTSFMDFAQQDIAEGLSNCVTRDGQSPATANLPMAGFRHSNVGDPLSSTQYETLGNNTKKLAPGITATGTADALVGTYSPVLPALVNNMGFIVRNSQGPNTVVNPTYDPDGFGAMPIRARGGANLQIGDLGPVEYELHLVYYSVGGYFELLNPYRVVTAQLLDDSVDNTKLANMETSRIKGRLTAGTGDPEDLTIAQVKTVLNLGALADLNSVGQNEIDANSIHTSEMATDDSDADLECWGSTGVNDQMVDQQALGGGRYGFWVQSQVTNDPSGGGTERTSFGAGGDQNGTSPSLGTFVSMQVMSTTISQFDPQTGFVRNRFVDSSAPWNMGHGDIALFIFLRIRADGRITGVNVCPAPTWGYNGPTSVVATRVSNTYNEEGEVIGVRKYKEIPNPEQEIILPPWRGGDPSLWTEEAAEAYARPEMVEVEIDHDIKNADMAVFPHPFFTMLESDTIVLVDPCSPIVDQLADLRKRESLEDRVGTLFKNGHIELTDEVQCTAPPGVIVKGARWKITG